MHALHRGVGAAPRDELIGWRYQYLTGAGLNPALAASMAEDLRWDLHALLELLERGCPPGLAARILAPADHEEVRRG